MHIWLGWRKGFKHIYGWAGARDEGAHMSGVIFIDM